MTMIKTQCPSQKKLAGYSLIEIALVISVISLIAGAFLDIYAKREEAEQLRKLTKTFDVIEEALYYHHLVAESLPCPADTSDLPNAAAYGVGDCTGSNANLVTTRDTGGAAVADDDIVIGTVPTRTLGLSEKYMYDPWGQKITYVMIQLLATAGETAAGTGFTTALDTGVIKIEDTSGNQITEASVNTVVAYALISHGPDKRGSYNIQGNLTACNATPAEGENCDFAIGGSEDNIFIDNEIINTRSNTNVSYFYDILRWKTLRALQF